MKIEAGKRYVRRDGTISGVIRKGCDNDLYPFFDVDSEEYYDENGLWLNETEHDEDLISEYVESQPAETETLRDRFAMAALAGLIGRNWDVDRLGHDTVIKQWGVSAYLVADAMLEARKK